MRRIYLSILAAFTGLTVSQAQDHNHAKCISHEVLQESLENPEYNHSYQAFRQAAIEYAQNPANEVVRNEYGTRIIPVVFHILHKGKEGNITKEQIDDQMRVFNEDFKRLNDDTTNTPVRFWGDAEVVDITVDVDLIEQFDDSLSSLRIGNRFGDVYGLYFGETLANEIQELVDFEIAVDPGTTNTSVATAIRDAIQGIPGLTASYSDTMGHVVRVIGDSLGFAADPVGSAIDSNIQTTVVTNGSLLPGRMDVEFRLAHKDPLGNCTEGIVRVFTSKTDEARNQTGFKAESYWTATQYLNVWVVNSIEHLGLGGTTLGYAQFPASGLHSTDGIAVRHDNIGTVGTAAPGNRVGRTSVHEVGHWLGLRHIWGDATCGTDDIADTPTAFEANFGICGNQGQQWYDQGYHVPNCNPDNWKGEMFNNYMDYVDDMCMNMFTINQVDRMNFTLHGDGTDFGVRSELVSQDNLEFTGTADPYVEDPGCAPTADYYHDQDNFFAKRAMICAGESVKFEDNSYNGVISSRSWSFEGGSPSSSSDEDPTIDYPNAGVYDVGLTVSGPGGTSNRSDEDYVIVSSVAAMNQSSWGYVQAFWDSATFADDFIVFNNDGTVNQWEWYEAGAGGFSGDQSARIFNTFNTTRQIDELITPSFDLSGLTDARLKFRYSGAAMNGTPSDVLEIFSSDNCGEKWRPRGTLEGQELTNAGFSSVGYTPNEDSPWAVADFNLAEHRDEPNVRIKFQWTSGGVSNHFYIDDITISESPIGVEEQNGDATWTLAPNPANNTTRLTMNTNGRADVDMKMYDLLGKEVRDLYHGELAKGSFNLDINLNGLESGMYVIKAYVNNQQITERLIVN